VKRFAYAQLQKKYGGRFIARKGSTVLAWAPTVKSLLKTLNTKGIAYTEKVTIGYVDPRGAICVYRISLPV
jgi:hypothetical protein